MSGFVGLNVKRLPIYNGLVRRLNDVESIWVDLIKSDGACLNGWVRGQSKSKCREQGNPYRKDTDDMFLQIVTRVNSIQF